MNRPSDAQTVPALLADMRRLGGHPAIVDAGDIVTYGELEERVHEVSRAYLANGVRRGDRVGLWAPNTIGYILAMLGAQSIGAAIVPINTRFTGPEGAAVLGRSRAGVLVVSDGFLGKSFSAILTRAVEESLVADPVSGGLPDLTRIVGLGSRPHGPLGMDWSEFLDSGRAIDDATLQRALAEVEPDDVMDILFTSGTTGLPKGAMTAHRQTIGVARAWANGADLVPEDRYAVVNPFFHGFGYKAGIVASLVTGATIYPVATFDPDALLELVQSERISVLPGVPTIFTTLIDHPRRSEYDLSSLRFAIAGATAAPETLFRDMVEILGFQRVAQAYGLTECIVATISRPGDSLEHIRQTTGPAVEGTEIRIVDERGDDLPVGADGEILLRGDNVMLGYFEDDAATRAAIDDDRWFHTGDVGRLDEHGCLKITDRLKDMFIVGGFNVYPAEVENVLRQHPAVNESAVIGVDDERLGAVGRAFVLLRQDALERPDAAALTAFCRDRLANFKVPREFVFVEDFPRNATGKIMKAQLPKGAEGRA